MAMEYMEAFIVGFLIGFVPVMTYARYKYWKRKKIQEDMVKRKADILESGHWFPVRYSSDDRFHSWFKSFPWEGTGILFMNKERVVFFGDLEEWKHIESIFTPENSRVEWIGRSIWLNGLASWVAITRYGKRHYFTSETGTTIYGSRKTTQEIYDKLKKVYSVNKSFP